MVRLISRQRGGLAVLKLTKLFGIDDFPAAKDSGKVLIIIMYCYLIINAKHFVYIQGEICLCSESVLPQHLDLSRETITVPYWLGRGSPIGFLGSGIWLISRPGFGILKEKGGEIRDCNYNWDTGFGDFNRRESGNIALKEPRVWNSGDGNMQRKSPCHLSLSY